ncbi:hypothetical protein R6Q59_023141 [Mikania micrantha]
MAAEPRQQPCASHETTSMSKRGKRGVASCKKKLREDQMYIEFDENDLPIGPNASHFDSRIGLALRSQFPYWVAKKTLQMKNGKTCGCKLRYYEYWHIPNDDAEKRTIIRAKKMRTDFLSKLYRNYTSTGINPCSKYKYFDKSIWNEFVAARSTTEAMAKSAKARLSALQNKNPARTGRSGYKGLKQKLDEIWTPLVESNPLLKDMKDMRSKLYVGGRRRKNPQTGKHDIAYDIESISNLIAIEKNMKRDGSYGDGKSDPLTQFLGREHGGRTRAVSSVTANGQTYPSCDRYLDDTLMHEHCVKVQVDYVNQNFLYIPVPEESKTEEITFMKDIVNMFVQWSRRAMKILNASTSNASQQFQTPSQTRDDAYVPELCHQFETNDDFLADTAFLDEIDNDSFIGIGLTAFEEPQTQLIQQQKAKIRQPKSKQARVKQSKAKGKGKQVEGKGKQVEGKAKDHEQQVEKVKIALKKIKKRPEWYQKMVSRLQNHIGNDWATQLHHSTTFGMFPTEHSSVLEPEALLQLFVNEWVDLTLCSFLHRDWLKSHRAEAEEHISSLYSYHSDKEYFLAPYLANGHWTLFIIVPRKAQVYILDSLRTMGEKDQTCYLLSQMWGDASVATEAYIDKLLKSIVPPLFERLGIR